MRLMLTTLIRFNEFGDDGGPAAQELMSKLFMVKKHLAATLAIKMPDIDLFYLVVNSPILYDFYNYQHGEIEHLILLDEFLQSVALFGALLFFVGMKNLIPRRQMKKKAASKAKVV
ncbi:hypothetical protein LINPERPRIM_LOCUS27989 [Linum perenne]